MISLQELTAFENSLIEHILYKEGLVFEEHLHLLEVKKRESTGVGIYIYFNYLKKPTTSAINKTIGQSVYAEIEGLKGGAGFMLYIDEGKITMLECFSHLSESWPSRIENYEIQDL